MATTTVGCKIRSVKLESKDGNNKINNTTKNNNHKNNKNKTISSNLSNNQWEGFPRLTLSKPCWLVKTESNVRKQVRKNPQPSCVVCVGSGRVHCPRCSGKGRTNHVDLVMLPKGEWPKWCRTCGGSGLSYCSRCLGTGEYRYIMGFHFMNTDHDDQRTHHYPDADDSCGAADRLLNAQ